MTEPIHLILASNSPRRRQLLGLGNWTFDVIVSDVDETQVPNETPKEYVLRLAQDKALAAAGKVDLESIVIGSDTAVIDGNEILGKPMDVDGAFRMLAQLRGRTHQVYTGVAVYRPADGKLLTELCVTDVPMRAYSDKEIRAYIQTGDPMDKAGAYAIQHPDFQPVESMRGCYASVMGLPMCHVIRALRKFDLHSDENVPLACQKLLSYECPVSAAILRGEYPSSPVLPPKGEGSLLPSPFRRGDGGEVLF
ncbi:MAG: septum formation protein Maf [Chloroflexi bacterium]|nr:septum formation protein Maf [Chloroflexota bacterium]